MQLVSVLHNKVLSYSTLRFLPTAIYCWGGCNFYFCRSQHWKISFNSHVSFQKHCPSYWIIHKPHCQEFSLGQCLLSVDSDGLSRINRYNIFGKINCSWICLMYFFFFFQCWNKPMKFSSPWLYGATTSADKMETTCMIQPEVSVSCCPVIWPFNYKLKCVFLVYQYSLTRTRPRGFC